MASFTDSISQFNPYIKQLPVEEMLKVGVYKQQKYDEGVQKIQSQIDNVAGMDVIKPIHKQYLQSKLNELGNNLKTVAGGDFSNYQLVNSVGGMATQIVKDPTIQGALLSTQRVRKGQEELETARKAGKSSVQNEQWWNKSLNDWMDDGDMKSQFNGRYVEYRDMEEKLRGVAEKVHEYDQSVEIPYKRDNGGNVLYFDAKGNVTTADRGKPRIDEAILKTKVKGKSAEKILSNFYTSLDENDMQQLRIDGWYHYRGYTGDGFKNKMISDITETYNAKKKNISDEVINLTTELATNNKLTAEQKTALQSQINKYNSYLKDGGFDKELQSRLSNIATTDETALKQSVYTEKFLTRLANDISYQTYETEFKNNPYFDAEMKKKDLEFKYWDAAERFKRDDRDYWLDKAKFEWDKAKVLLEKTGEDVTFEDLGVRTEGKELPTASSAIKNINSLNDEIEGIRREIGNHVANYNNLSEPEKRAVVSNVVNDYIKNPKSVTDNSLRKLYEKYRSASMEMTRKMGNYVAIADKAKKFDVDLDNLLKGQKNIKDQSGRSFSAKDVMSVINDVNDNVKYKTTTVALGGSMTGVGSTETRKIKDFTKAVEKYKGTPYEGLVTAYVYSQGGALFGVGLDSADAKTKGVAKEMNTLVDVYNKSGKPILQRKNEFVSGELAKSMPEYQMAVGALNMKDKGTAAKVDKIISEMYSIYDEFGSLDVQDKDMFDPGKISGWMKKGEDLRFVIKKSADNSSGSLQIINGKDIQEIPLDRRRLSKYFPAAAKGHPLEAINLMIASSTNKTTNAMNIVNPQNSSDGAVNAAFSGEQLPLLNGSSIAPLIRYDIEGDPDNTGDSETNGYQLRMYVNDNGTWKSKIINDQGFTSLNGIYSLLQNIGTRQFEEVKLYGK